MGRRKSSRLCVPLALIALASRLGQAVMASGHALVRMEFKRDVSLKRWISEVRDNLEEARKANLISTTLEQHIGDGLANWFSPLKHRGYEQGDRLYYAVAPDSVRTVVTTAGGEVLLVRVDSGRDERAAVLATYFAPGSEFRAPLPRSLFEARN